MRQNNYLDGIADGNGKDTVKAVSIVTCLVGGFIIIAHYVKEKYGTRDVSGWVNALSFPQSTYKYITVTLTGAFGVLPSGEVVISRRGVVLARGPLSSAMLVRASGTVDISITVTGLLDQPIIVSNGVVLPQSGSMTVPVDIGTGLVRSEATVGGRTVSGVVRLYRVDPVTGVVSSGSCCSMGANGNPREISEGTYSAVLLRGGSALRQTVTVERGSSKLIRLVG